MAVQATVTTEYGEDRSIYIRINNIETSNHGVPSNVKFRGFLSRETFELGGRSVWEKDMEFDADISIPLWPQAYEELKVQQNWTDAVDLLE